MDQSFFGRKTVLAMHSTRAPKKRVIAGVCKETRLGMEKTLLHFVYQPSLPSRVPFPMKASLSFLPLVVSNTHSSIRSSHPPSATLPLLPLTFTPFPPLSFLRPLFSTLFPPPSFLAPSHIPPSSSCPSPLSTSPLSASHLSTSPLSASPLSASPLPICPLS